MEKKQNQAEEIKKVTRSDEQTKNNPACAVCLSSLAARMFGEFNHHPEAVLEAMKKGELSAVMLHKIFATKLRQMYFYYGEKVAERLREAGDNRPVPIPSFLAVDEWYANWAEAELKKAEVTA